VCPLRQNPLRSSIRPCSSPMAGKRRSPPAYKINNLILYTRRRPEGQYKPISRQIMRFVVNCNRAIETYVPNSWYGWGVYLHQKNRSTTHFIFAKRVKFSKNVHFVRSAFPLLTTTTPRAPARKRTSAPAARYNPSKPHCVLI